MFPTPQQKTQSFLKTIEAGDLALYEPFVEALAVFGFTKAGKTSTCHMLANSTLKAELKNGDLVYRPVSNIRFGSAKVGLTNESQTEIPNVFDATFTDKANNRIKMTILDQPGYGDSYGFHRIFSNGYFHYRTLSKTPKLKFLVVLERKDLTGVAEKLKKVIFLFINSFTPYESLKGQILKATCFLISKAEVGTKLEDINNILKTLRDTMAGMTVKNRVYFQEFINNMIDNNKVFIIEKPKAAGNQTQSNIILRTICEKTQFWERKMIGSCADMTNVNFSVAGEVLSELSSYKDNQLFNEDFDAFMVEIKHKIKNLMKEAGNPSSLRNIITQLTRDAMAHSQSSEFLEGMTNFNNQYYNFDQNFREKRDKVEATLFQVAENPELSETRESGSPLKRNNEDKIKEKEKKESDRRLLYFIKKFNVLSHIATEAKNLMDEDYEIFNRRNHQTLERLSAFFVDIFRKFDCLRSQRKGYEKTISRYCYIIQRLIDESKIMIQILFSNNETRDKFINLKQDLILDAEILFPISEIITYFEGIPVKEMKREFIEKLNLQNLDFPITKEVIEFFESVPDLQLQTQVKIARILLRYNSDMVNNKKVNLHEEMQFVGEKLLRYHELFAFTYQSADRKMKDALTEVLFMMTKAIGDLLAKNSYHEPAREVLKTIHDAEGIFQLFELQLKNLQSTDPSIRNLYMEYAKTAFYYQRTELALRCCQEAYHRSMSLAEIKGASELLIKVTTKQSEDAKVEYLSKLFSEEFCGRIESKLLDVIKPAFGIQEY